MAVDATTSGERHARAGWSDLSRIANLCGKAAVLALAAGSVAWLGFSAKALLLKYPPVWPDEADFANSAINFARHGKLAVSWTRFSCHRFRGSELRLWLSVTAYNLGNLWRRLGLPNRIRNWSLTSLQQRLVKTGGRLVKRARYYWLLLAESHLTRRLFGAMLGRIAALPLPTG